MFLFSSEFGVFVCRIESEYECTWCKTRQSMKFIVARVMFLYYVRLRGWMCECVRVCVCVCVWGYERRVLQTHKNEVYTDKTRRMEKIAQLNSLSAKMLSNIVMKRSVVDNYQHTHINIHSSRKSIYYLVKLKRLMDI